MHSDSKPIRISNSNVNYHNEHAYSYVHTHTGKLLEGNWLVRLQHKCVNENFTITVFLAIIETPSNSVSQVEKGKTEVRILLPFTCKKD